MALALTGSSGGGGGGGGTVTSVTATDTSIVVAGTAAAPTIATGTLDVIATDHPPAANWSNNAKKITALANGTVASDAAAFGQIPAALPPNGAAGGDLTGTYPNPTLGASGVTAATYGDSTHVAQVAVDAKGRITAASNVASPTSLPPNGTAGGDLSGTYPNPAVKAITETSGPTDLVIGTVTDGQFLKRVGGTLVSAAGGTGTVTSVTATDTSIVVAGTAAAPTIATGTLDAIAAAHAPAANWSNNSHKITSLANGTAAQDAAAFVQIPLDMGLPVDGAKRQTVPRWIALSATTLTSGTLRLVGIMLVAGESYTTISFCSSSTPLNTGTHQIFGIFDDSLGSSSGTGYARLAQTSDDTSTAWTANTTKTLTISGGAYSAVRSGFHYLGVLVAATTVPTLGGLTSGGVFNSFASVTGGNSSTALTALPNPAAAPSGQNSLPWAYLS